MFGIKLSEPRPFFEPGPAEQRAENPAFADELMEPVPAADKLMESVEEQGYNDNRSQLVVCANPLPSTARHKLVVGLTTSKSHVPSNDRRG